VDSEQSYGSFRPILIIIGSVNIGPWLAFWGIKGKVRKVAADASGM
jgi:hypothetical protein